MPTLGPVQIAQSADDAYQQNATSYTDGNIIYLSGDNMRAGWRFSLDIPQAATVNSVTFEVYFINSSYLTINADFYCEAADSAAVFTTTASDITNRSLTTNKATWNQTVAGIGFCSHPGNLVPAVQEVINRSGWAANNYLAVIAYCLGGSSNARLRDYYASSSQAARITIDYTAPSGGKPHIYYAMMAEY